MNKHQDLKCFFRLHKNEVLKEEILTDTRNNAIGKVIISRCANCGKITHCVIYTTDLRF